MVSPFGAQADEQHHATAATKGHNEFLTLFMVLAGAIRFEILYVDTLKKCRIHHGFSANPPAGPVDMRLMISG